MTRSRKYFFIGSILWSLFILSLTILPASELPSISVKGIDKVIHFVLFFGFGFLVSGAIASPKRSRYYVLSFLLTVIYGITVEWLQQFIPGRTADEIDVIFNLLGALSGISLYLMTANKFAD